MEPRTYVERPSEIQAVQWDGTDEALQWILGQFDGRASVFQDENGPQIEIQGPVHPFVLDREVWVFAGTTVYPTWMTNEKFRAFYVEKT